MRISENILIFEKMIISKDLYNRGPRSMILAERQTTFLQTRWGGIRICATKPRSDLIVVALATAPIGLCGAFGLLGMGRRS